MPPKLVQKDSDEDYRDRTGGQPTPVAEIFFVPYKPPSASKREVEIIDAARRAYIARRWHSKQRHTENAALRRSTSEQQSIEYKYRGIPTSGVSHHPTSHTNATLDQQSRQMTDTAITILPPQVRWSSLDPFNASGFSLDPNAASVLQYFQLTWAHTAFRPARTCQHPSIIADQEPFQVMRYMQNDSLVTHAFLAAVAMRMTTVHNVQSKAAEHASRALTELRRLIGFEIANSDRILLTILFLAAFETYCFNIDGTRAHLQALRLMNAQNRLTGYFRDLCQHVDLFSAAAALTVPIFPPPRVTSLLEYTELNVGSGFFEIDELAEADMREVIRNVISCAVAAEQYKEQARTGRQIQQQAQDIVTQSESLQYQLLHQLPGSEIKQACIIALLMWLSYLPVSIMTTNDHSVSGYGKDLLKIIPGRGTWLVNRLKACSPLSTHLHLWILAVGVICAVDAEDTGFCATEFVKLARRLSITNVQTCLRRFLWLDDFDLIDGSLLEQLLCEDEVSASALRTIVEWSTATKGVSRDLRGNGTDTGIPMRLTKRPSNRYRLGA